MKKILIVEDSPLVRDLIKQSLSRENISFLEASNGVEALTLLRKRKPALILLDIMMPDMDGLSFMEELNKIGHLKAIPVVVLTALSERRVVDELKALGIKDLIFKPFTPAMLRTVVEKHLKSK